jgi:hypothetical protein
MQTLHLRFRDLRAILLGGTPSRWPTPSAAMRDETKGPPGLSNSPRPTSAVGAHPETSHQRLDQCPTVGAGLTMASSFPEPCVCGATVPDTRQVCWPQTAKNNPHPVAHHKAGQVVVCSLQARHSEVQWTPSHGLSFSIRPQHFGARSRWKRTSDIAGVASVRKVAQHCSLSSAGG